MALAILAGTPESPDLTRPIRGGLPIGRYVELIGVGSGDSILSIDVHGVAAVVVRHFRQRPEPLWFLELRVPDDSLRDICVLWVVDELSHDLAVIVDTVCPN